MGSSASSISSASPSYNANPAFSGTSTYSSSFQQVLTRAVNTASLPMQETQADINTATGQQNAITQLESTFKELDTALQAVGTAAAGSNSATVSAPSSVSASTTSSALPGTYSIQVDTMGSYTTMLSPAGSTTVTDPSTQNISSASSFTLTVNSVSTTITPSGGSLEDLASAINSSSADVQATVVNLGSNSSPDYRLAVTGTSLSSDTISLTAGGSNLLDLVSSGGPATYQVNGSSTVLESNSSQVTLAPGLTVTMLAPDSSAATITVSTDYSGLQSALTNFATAYNSAVSAVQGQIGQSGGALSGQSIVYTLNDVLSAITQYSSNSTGSVNTLSELGLSVDPDTGEMSFDASSFSGQNTADITQFLGGVSTGGFLETAENALTSVDDSTAGDLATEYNTLQTEINGDNQQVSHDEGTIGLMETNLEAELAQADAAIATLQTQQDYFKELFQAEYPSSSS